MEMKVLKYILNHSNLIPVLLEAEKEIDKFFPSCKLTLEVFEDPEGIEEDKLILYIHCINEIENVETAIRKLIEFDKEWFNDVSSLCNDNLIIDVVGV